MIKQKKSNYLSNTVLLEEIKKSKEQNKPTDKLVKAFVLLVDRIARKSSWIGYTYADDIKAAAILHMFNTSEQDDVPNWRKFDPSFAEDYPFYLTGKPKCSITRTQYETLIREEQRNYSKRYPNPFSFYTEMIHNSIRQSLTKEKRQQQIRDDLLEQAGMNPSHTRQNYNEEEKGEQK